MTAVLTEDAEVDGAADPLAFRVCGAAEVPPGRASRQVPDDQTPVVDADDVTDTSTGTRHHCSVLWERNTDD